MASIGFQEKVVVHRKMQHAVETGGTLKLPEGSMLTYMEHNWLELHLGNSAI